MNTRELSNSLTALFSELVDGAPQFAYMLNTGDPGLLRSLDRLSASAASNKIAAHVDHVRYGLSLMNRWASGEPNPFATADWTAAWRTTHVSDAEWAELRGKLRDEAHRWLAALGTPREVDDVALNGMIGSIAHLAYHLGAIRQIDRATHGPAEPVLEK
ncbi:MAG TPA: hypothetical protein VK807_23230 [Gemmatimonadaceae bacterium]|nr:hypothetical protein [Gemmatimonadaceae bacterium]